jgi:predicted signal transduction protein with EAL and GGDEF domain
MLALRLARRICNALGEPYHDHEVTSSGSIAIGPHASEVPTLGTSPQTSAIVSSIVGLGQSLHVTITAEGVETEGQAAMLRKWGCDQVQGFYYGKPDADVPQFEESTAKEPQVA